MTIRKLAKGVLFVIAGLFLLAFVELCFLSCTARAESFRILEADEISIDYLKIADYRHGYYVDDMERFNHGANFNLNLRLCKYAFVENRLHFLGTESQIRAVGWEYRAGFDIGKYLQVFHYHHSQHILEREAANEGYRFPLENMYGVRLFFHRR